MLEKTAMRKSEPSMPLSKVINVEALTVTEEKVYCLNGIGKQTKEIADILNSSYETAKSHMKNIKTKLGLGKDKEITAHFWCTLMDKDFDEVKRQVLATCLLVLFLIFIPFDTQIKASRHHSSRVRRTLIARRNEYLN